MTGELKVSPDKLITASNEFKKGGTKIRTLTTNMTDLVKNTNSMWEGDAGNAFRTKFGQLSKDITTLISMVLEHSDDLAKMAETYTKEEEKIKEQIQQLSSNLIE